jgi:hypothetical protein
MIEEFNYISVGYDCSTASALKNLKLRNAAHPFDWTEISFVSFEKCILDNFKQFHKNIVLNTKKQRVIDDYGIQFPHDYPTVNSPKTMDGVNYPEYKICDDYEKYTDQVLEKYGRRIERFRNIMADKSHPLIVLYRGTHHDATKIKSLLETTYQREHIIVVVATKEPLVQQNKAVIVCDPEINKIWNENEIWRAAIENAKLIYPILLIPPKIKRFSMKIW